MLSSHVCPTENTHREIESSISAVAQLIWYGHYNSRLHTHTHTHREEYNRQTVALSTAVNSHRTPTFLVGTSSFWVIYLLFTPSSNCLSIIKCWPINSVYVDQIKYMYMVGKTLVSVYVCVCVCVHVITMCQLLCCFEIHILSEGTWYHACRLLGLCHYWLQLLQKILYS